MPLDLNVANSIIQAFSQGKSDRLNKEKFSQQQKEHAEQLKFQQEQLKQQHDLEQARLDQQHEYQGKMLEHAGVQLELQKLGERQKISDRYAKGLGAGDATVEQSSPYTKPRAEEPQQAQGFIQGVIPQDTEVGNAPVPVNMPIPGMNNIPEGQVELDSPILGKVRSFTPEFYSKQQGQMTELEQAPLEARKIREQAAAQKEISDREQSNTALKQQFEAAKIQAEIEGRENVANINAASRLKAAKANNESSKTSTQALRIADKFDTHDITKRYNVIKEAAQTVNSIPDDSKNPQDDQQLIYAFAKTMDPQSTVREGEYTTVQRYAQTMADRFGFAVDRINKNVPFLTPEARRNIKATITNRAKIEQKAYENVRNEAAKQLKTIGADPESWLKDYGNTEGGKGEFGPIETKTLKDGTEVSVKKNLKTGKYVEASGEK